MTSLLRDMYVDIPGRDGNRLNAAYSFGGPELLLETVKQNLGIEVNRYAVVNFQAFANLVDAVNGVNMELTNEEVKWVNAYLNEYNELGEICSGDGLSGYLFKRDDTSERGAVSGIQQKPFYWNGFRPDGEAEKGAFRRDEKASGGSGN